ncbi:MAG TPA: hypothetical protein PKG69_05265 [Methanoregulaceae archaeon]|nr:hypothetical protein [Methanoregulaceae archaeon]
MGAGIFVVKHRGYLFVTRQEEHRRNAGSSRDLFRFQAVDCFQHLPQRDCSGILNEMFQTYPGFRQESITCRGDALLIEYRGDP